MRIETVGTAPETELLTQFLDFQRATVVMKADGLSGGQLARTHPPSTLSLGGILNHLALVEDYWAQVRFLGLPEGEPWAQVDWTADPDWEFRTAAECPPDELHDRYRQACDRTRAVVLRAASLDVLSVVPLDSGQQFSLRWMMLHLIEETARHAGHADLLREAIDGTVGE